MNFLHSASKFLPRLHNLPYNHSSKVFRKYIQDCLIFHKKCPKIFTEKIKSGIFTKDPVRNLKEKDCSIFKV